MNTNYFHILLAFIRVYSRFKKGLQYEPQAETIIQIWDCNGRMVRLVANVPVIMAGYPPIIIAKERPQEYINALSEYHQFRKL